MAEASNGQGDDRFGRTEQQSIQVFLVTLSLILVIGSQYGLLQQNRLGNIGG